MYVGDRQAFVKCAADPKPEGRQSFGNDRGGRGGGRGRGGDRGGRQSFGGERQERNDEATVFVKNLPWSATQDGVWEMFGNNVKVTIERTSLFIYSSRRTFDCQLIEKPEE